MEEDEEYEDDNFNWQDGTSDFDCESGDEVEDIPESSDGIAGAEPMKKNKSGSTTESYSSVLQDEDEEDDEVDEEEEEEAETAEDDAQCDNGDILRDLLTDIANGNHLGVKLSPTDSESFTTSEQLMTQRFVDIYATDKRTSSD